MAVNLLFDLLAPLYDRLISPPDPDQLHHLLDLPTHGWLLDAGGGTGRVSTSLRPLVGGLVLTDLSLPMLKQAQAKVLCCPVQASTHRLPYPNAYFDRILVVDALHHFSDQSAAIADLLRVLKPGGRMLIEEPDIHRFPVKLIALIEKLALMNSHFHTPQQIKALVESHGGTARLHGDDQFAAWVIVNK